MMKELKLLPPRLPLLALALALLLLLLLLVLVLVLLPLLLKPLHLQLRYNVTTQPSLDSRVSS